MLHFNMKAKVVSTQFEKYGFVYVKNKGQVG
jgi:predicted RNA binding protein YcfA (HicA-like mRNA interferase family)